MLLWLLILVPAVWTVVYRFRRRNMYKLAGLIPEPKEALPLIGLAHTFIGSTEDIMVSLQKYSYAAIEHDGIVTGWISHILYFLVVDPVDLEMVLKTCMEKDDLHRFIRKIIGYGGIFAPDRKLQTKEMFSNTFQVGLSIWRRRRKILVPAFSPKIVENFVDVFSEQSQKLSQHLSKSAEKKEKFGVWSFLSTYTLDSVFETAMGVKIDAQGNPESVFLKSINRILNLVCERIFHLWLQPDWLYRFFRWKHLEHQKCLSVLHRFTDDIIEQKRKEINSQTVNKAEGDDKFDLGKYKNKTFLELLITLSGGENGYTNMELREEMLTLTVAGTDTSAVCIGYTLMLLGKYPDVQQKVYEELSEVFGDSDRPLVKEDLMKLKYLERVVKESLRLFPPVPFIIRKVLEDIKLPSGRVLPGGSGIAVSIWGVHRDPKYWGPDAEHFDPDRFLPERFNLAHACSFMPFSNGPRNCLGYQYALMSIKTALSSILRRYKVIGDVENSKIPRIRVKLDIMMKAVDGYEITLETRQKPQPSDTLDNK